MADEKLRTATDLLKARGTPPWKAAEDVLKRENYRIEALRAASRIVAGILAGEKKIVGDNDDASLSGSVFSLAEQFARWLETGRRDD